MTTLLARHGARLGAALFAGLSLYSAELGLAVMCLRLLTDRYLTHWRSRERQIGVALAADAGELMEHLDGRAGTTVGALFEWNLGTLSSERMA